MAKERLGDWPRARREAMGVNPVLSAQKRDAALLSCVRGLDVLSYADEENCDGGVGGRKRGD